MPLSIYGVALGRGTDVTDETTDTDVKVEPAVVCGGSTDEVDVKVVVAGVGLNEIKVLVVFVAPFRVTLLEEALAEDKVLALGGSTSVDAVVVPIVGSITPEAPVPVVAVDVAEAVVDEVDCEVVIAEVALDVGDV